MRRAILASLALAFALPAGACDDQRAIAWERHRAVLGPIPLKDRVAYVDTARDRVVVLDFSAGAPSVFTRRIGRNAIYAVPAPDRERLAVLTAGEEAIAAGMVEEEPTLWLVETGDQAAEPVAFPLGSPFDRLAIASDGQAAVAYFSNALPQGGLIRNPNELAFLDLGRDPDEENPLLKTVRSFGSAPEGVILSPPIRVPGAPDDTPRTFAFVLSQENVTVVDATYPERREVSIRLQGTGEGVMPRQIVFDPGSATAYLRSEGARDVLELILLHDPPSERDPLDNDYRAVVAELGAGGGPADIAFWDDPGGRRLILAATPGTREVVVIEAATGQFRSIATPDPIDRIVLFPPDRDAPARTAVLASLGHRLPRVHVMPLDDVTDLLAPVRIRTVDLEEPVVDVVPVPRREMAMLVHDDARTVLGLLDVAVGSVAPLLGVGRLDTYGFSFDGEYLIGASHGHARLGFLDLGRLHPSDLRLDDLPERAYPLSGGSVLVDHGDPFGLATWLPSPAAGRDEAVVLSGFLLAGVLDEGF